MENNFQCTENCNIILIMTLTTVANCTIDTIRDDYLNEIT